MSDSNRLKKLITWPTSKKSEPRQESGGVSEAEVSNLSNLHKPPDLRGCIDRYQDGVIGGWAVSTQNLLTSIDLEVRLLGKPAGRVRTQFDRADVSEILGFQVKCGFHFKLSDLQEDAVILLVNHLTKDETEKIGDLIEIREHKTKSLLPTTPDFAEKPVDTEQLRREISIKDDPAYHNEIISIRDRLLETSDFTHSNGTDVRILANYLPQFHPFAENNEWWGEGFTEWTNVVSAKQYFPDHHQPRLPADLGFYDLRLDSVHEQQIAMAKQYGVTGFIYYYYWFSGKNLMTMPIDRHLENDYDLDFCLCWANESWSRRWDGSEADVLMAQRHTEADDEAFIQSCLQYFASDRYIKIDGAPLLQVYRISLMANPIVTLARWREIVQEAGYPDLHISMCETFDLSEPNKYGCDSSSQFPPHRIVASPQNASYKHLEANYTGQIYNYDEVVQNEIARPRPNHTQFRGAMPSWDNTSRRGPAGNIFHGATPALFQAWLTHLVDDARANLPENKRFIIINAWNEWAEGAYLEPDRTNGRANLDAVRNALAPEHKALVALQAPKDGPDHLSQVRQYVENLINSNHQMRSILQAGYTGHEPSRGSFIPIKSGLMEVVALPEASAIIDRIQGRRATGENILTQERDLPLLVEGWIRAESISFKRSLPIFASLRKADSIDGTATRFIAMITDRPNRADVREFLKLDEAESWCGFRANFRLGKIPSGLYRLEFLIGDTSNSGRAFQVDTKMEMVVG